MSALTHSTTIVAGLVAVTMLLTLSDVAHHPRWTWIKAEEHRTAHVVLILLLPVIGTVLYFRRARPRLHALVVQGRAAILPFEQFGVEAHAPLAEVLEDTDDAPEAFAVPTSTSLPRGSFAEVRTAASVEAGLPVFATETPQTLAATETVPVLIATDERDPRKHDQEHGADTWIPVLYRHNTRRGLELPSALAEGTPPSWQGDPTGRHQYRYWDGAAWSSHVADGGTQGEDVIA